MKRVVVTGEVDDAGRRALGQPQDHFVRERPVGPDHFDVDLGPFTHWDRRVVVEPGSRPGLHRVTTTVEFRLALPLLGWLVTPFVARNLRRTGGRGRRSWWMPPLMDARSTAVLDVLAVLALVAGYLGVLISQTNTFFRAEFGATSSEVADAQIAVRIGAFAALALAALADRWGRRRTLLVATTLGILLAATGAFVPNLAGITISQGVARVFSTCMIIVGSVMAAEEVPARARASAQSILALLSGAGAGVVVLLLWVAGLSPGAWRFLYLVPLPFLAAVPALARRLPESRRFEVADLGARRNDRPDDAPGATTGGDTPAGVPAPVPTPAPAPAGPTVPATTPVGATVAAAAPAPAAPAERVDRRTYRRRLVLVGVMLALFNLYVTPWSGFTNDFLQLERDFSAWQLTVFQVITAGPGGFTIVLGGLLADAHGRKAIGVLGLIGGTAAGVAMFLTDGWMLWLAATAATVLGCLLVATVLVYPTELFPTSLRGRAQGWNNLWAVGGAVVGLKVCGVLADRWGSYAMPITLLGIGPVVAALVVLRWFPETSGRELEELNPGDVPPPTGEDLAALDRRWEDRRDRR